MKNFIKINLPDSYETRTVKKKDYIIMKTKQLKEFGYGNLTEQAVEEQLDKLLKGEALTIIEMFMNNEVIMEIK